MKLVVPDMSCNHCKMKIEKALNEKGFKDVAVDLESKEVTFDLNGNSEETAKETIVAEGYSIQ